MTFSNGEIERLNYPLQPAMTPALLPCILHVDEFEALVFEHHEFRQVSGPHPGQQIEGTGTTVWIAATEIGQCACISFIWAVVSRGVLVCDLATISSNVHLVDDEHAPLTNMTRFRLLSAKIWAMGWTDAVGARLASGQ